MSKTSSALFDRVPSFSFEFFPPKTEKGAASLLKTILELQQFNPSFVSITYGANGSTRSLTQDIVTEVQSRGIPTVPHLTCIGHTEEEIEHALETYTQAGARAFLALRGDHKKGSDTDPGNQSFKHASQLVRFIREWEERQKLPYHLTVGVAGFCEGHPESPNRLKELDHLKAKVDEGADYICTQLFFDNHTFFDFRDRCRLIGIDQPIIAGIMPITSLSSMQRMSELAAGTNFPAKLLKAMLRAGRDRTAIERVGTHYASNQCAELLDEEVDGIHFYTLNQSKATLNIYHNLGIYNTRDIERIHKLNELYNNA